MLKLSRCYIYSHVTIGLYKYNYIQTVLDLIINTLFCTGIYMRCTYHRLNTNPAKNQSFLFF